MNQVIKICEECESEYTTNEFDVSGLCPDCFKKRMEILNYRENEKI